MKSNAVTVLMKGGLGNQLFQYATGRSIAEKFGARLVLDTAGYESDPLRRFELTNLNFSYTVRRHSLLTTMLSQCTPSFFSKLLKLQRKTVYAEKDFSFDQGLTGTIPPLVLDGYWQSERYFLSIKDTLRKEFGLKTALSHRNAAILQEINSTAIPVSLHIRRGDYAQNPVVQKKHGTCSLEYYNNALKVIESQLNISKLFIFSDDMAWAKNNLVTDISKIFVVGNENCCEVDLLLMKSCSHHIIANSTFSWWGAWLNPSDEKIVISPKKWFNDTTNTSDLIPDPWIRI